MLLLREGCSHVFFWPRGAARVAGVAGALLFSWVYSPSTAQAADEFPVETVTVTESGDPYTLTVFNEATLDALDGALSLDVAGSTASLGDDFTVGSGSQLLSPPTVLTIGADDTSLTLTVVPVDDKRIESDEVINLNVSLTTSVDLPHPWDRRGETAERTVLVFKAEIKIEDDEVAGLGFKPSSLTMDEGSVVGYTVALDAQPASDVTVGVTNSDSAAATVSLARILHEPAEIELGAADLGCMGADRAGSGHDRRPGCGFSA